MYFLSLKPLCRLRGCEGIEGCVIKPVFCKCQYWSLLRHKLEETQNSTLHHEDKNTMHIKSRTRTEQLIIMLLSHVNLIVFNGDMHMYERQVMRANDCQCTGSRWMQVYIHIFIRYSMDFALTRNVVCSSVVREWISRHIDLYSPSKNGSLRNRIQQNRYSIPAWDGNMWQCWERTNMRVDRTPARLTLPVAQVLSTRLSRTALPHRP